jgi:hypothetical protein
MMIGAIEMHIVAFGDTFDKLIVQSVLLVASLFVFFCPPTSLCSSSSSKVAATKDKKNK